MRVTIDRNLCGSWPPACEECFNMFVARDYAPDRACITGMEEDGSETLTAIIRSGHFVGTLTIRPEDRETVMREGWTKFSTLPVEAFDITPPRGDDLRTRQAEN